MAGLSRSKNLSERGLNLKTALQKLYAPGIEDDIELFSLSSKITSAIIGGPEILSSSDPLSQIYSIESQKIKVKNLSGTFTTLDRTKFNTRYFTFTNDNEVYFTKFNITPGSGTVSRPIFSSSGSVPRVELVYGGRGFYFENDDDDASIYTSTSQEVTLNSVKLIGAESGANTLTANIVFEKETISGTTEETAELNKFTPGSTVRYRIKSILVAGRGVGYIVPERLKIVLDEFYSVSGTSTRLRLRKQTGTIFASTDPIIRSAQYFYRVVNADATGFFLYDDIRKQYIFLNLNSTSITGSQIELKRNDSIKIENLLQFKFAGSLSYLRGYEDAYRIGDSISGELSSLGGNVQNQITSVRTAIQNTKLPTLPTSDDNTLGYQYNEFVGRDVVIWQRVVIRDQDFLLDPGQPGSRTGLTGDKLKDDVDNFILSLTGGDIKVPGLFIKVGNDYFRAFSTIDKPFFTPIGTAIANPNISSSQNRGKTDIGALSAEGYFNNAWYSHNTQIAQLAQRIHPNGKDGAFYYHRDTAPTIREISINKGGTASKIYAIPLFKAS